MRAKRVDNSGISDQSEQVLFDHLSDDDLVTLLANPGGALSAALVTRLALIPGGLPGRAEWVSDLSTDTETVRLSEQLRERLTSQRERLTLWWEQLKPNDRRYITEHRAGALAADYAEIISAASELAATRNDGAEFLLPTIIRVFVEWKMSE